MNALVSVADARRAVLALARRTAAERVSLAAALGRTLAADVHAQHAQPPFDASAMDGWALHGADLARLPSRLAAGGTVHAGDAAPPPLSPGMAIAVMTGAMLPEGTAAVVPVEHTRRDGDAVVVGQAVGAGKHVRRRGEAVAEGAVLLAGGTVVHAGAMGVLASAGAGHVWVARRPTVAVVATGDELVDAGEALAPGQVTDSNGPGLAAQVVASGGVALGPLRARDTDASVEAALDAAADADVLVVAGGVSMGERDLVRDALARRGAAWDFWGVAQRPGKPLAAGRLADGRPVVALPGNPVSAAVCFEVYVRPLLAAMLGRVPPEPPTVAARLADAIDKPAGLHVFVRVTATVDDEARLSVSPTGPQGSHVAPSLALSDGIAHLPTEWSEAPAGAVVAFEPWAW